MDEDEKILRSGYFMEVDDDGGGDNHVVNSLENYVHGCNYDKDVLKEAQNFVQVLKKTRRLRCTDILFKKFPNNVAAVDNKGLRASAGGGGATIDLNASSTSPTSELPSYIYGVPYDEEKGVSSVEADSTKPDAVASTVAGGGGGGTTTSTNNNVSGTNNVAAMWKVSMQENKKKIAELNSALVGNYIYMEIVANEMWRLHNCKLNAKLIKLFSCIPIPVYNAVIKTSIYCFRSRLQKGDRQDNKVQYSPKAQYYVNILKSCKQLSFHNPLTFIGMKCAYCDAHRKYELQK